MLISNKIKIIYTAYAIYPIINYHISLLLSKPNYPFFKPTISGGQVIN